MRVTVVEIRQPMHDDTITSSVYSLVMTIVSSPVVAEFFIRAQGHVSDHEIWAWAVYEMDLDDPKGMPYETRIYDCKGKPSRYLNDAWDLCRKINAKRKEATNA